MTPRTAREYKNLSEMDIKSIPHQKVAYLEFSEEEQREIVFKDMTTGEITHTTSLDTAGIADYRSVLGYFTQTIMKELRLISGYDHLYGYVKQFVAEELFGKTIDLESANTIRNLSEIDVTRTLINTFKVAINALTIRESGDAEIKDYIKLRKTRPFQVKDQPYLMAKKSVFNKIVGDKGFELQFAAFLDHCPGVNAFTKNFFAIGFKLDYIKTDGDISTYTPDFIVRGDDGRHWIIETKGMEEIDLPRKMARLKQWCEDVNRVQSEAKWGFIYVPQEEYERTKPKTLAELVAVFKEYQDI
jgi:type III restriction enzyme